MKWFNIIGLSLSILGSIMVGLIAQGGVAKRGKPINAPNYKITLCGWSFVIAGFILSLISEILS